MATRKKAKSKSKAKRKTTRVGGSISESQQIPDCPHLRRLPADAPPIARHGSLRHLGHEHLGNSLPTHLGDLEAPSLPDEVIAYDRYPAKPKNRKACQCLVLAFARRRVSRFSEPSKPRCWSYGRLRFSRSYSSPRSHS